MTPANAEWTVSDLNLMIAEAIRRDPRTRSVTVRGEISGFKHHIASGHWYFSLKDDMASISCVMFRQNNIRTQIRPRDGMSIVVNGYVDIYPKAGTCQLYVTGMRVGGAGELYARFEELKRRLYEEGLFDPARKKKLPMVPRKVAVITSASGAALHDILNVSGARSPGIPILIIPTPVQGPGAAEQIAASIRKANLFTNADVIIIARGGGSAEDLWCFNEEPVARAVAESLIPVVSGVGHEIDTTICDLAADVRAATPSNAAEIVFPDRREMRERIGALKLHTLKAVRERIREAELQLRSVSQRIYANSPERIMTRLLERCSMSGTRLHLSMTARLENERNRLEKTDASLRNTMIRRMDRTSAALDRTAQRLKGINPLAVMERGFALVTTEEGAVLSTAHAARQHREMTVRFTDGNINVIRKDQNDGTDRSESRI